MNTSLVLRRVIAAFAVAVFVGGIVSCSSSTTPTPTRAELLTRPSGWKFSSITLVPPDPTALQGLQVLLGDATATYTTAGAVTITFNSTAALATGAQRVTGQWRLTNNDTQIVYSGFTFPQAMVPGLPQAFNVTYDIQELTSSALTIRTGTASDNVTQRWVAN